MCNHLEWMGIGLDPAANAANALTISQPDSRIGVYVVPTNEEQIIAQQTYDTLTGVL